MLKVLKSSLITSDLNQTVNDNDNMLTNGSNQYIQPDYLSPLPTTLDSKRSPLALLAQTCSQIGADPTPTSTTSTTTATTTSSVTKSVDKQSKKSMTDNEKTAKTPPQSKHDIYNRQETKEIESKSGFKSPTTKSSSPPVIHPVTQQPDNNGTKLMAEQRIALDMAMQQQQQLSKDIQQSMLANYRPSSVFSSPMSSLAHHPLSAYHHPGLAGLDAATAAALGAFRHPAYMANLSYPHHVPVSFGLASYHQHALSAVSSYGQRLQQHSNNKTNDASSICRDPYCTTCPMNSPVHNVSTSSSPNNNSPRTTTGSNSSCPAGCTQCDHVTRTTSSAIMNTTATLSSTSSVSSMSTSMSTSTTPIVTSAPDTSALLRPYVCNWIAADHYCGKRFTSSEELLQHLRTHTSLSSTPSVESSSHSPTYSHASLHPHSAHLLAASALHRTYPTPPLSPLSMARYHPYNVANKHLNSSAALQQHPAVAATAAAAPSPLMSLHHQHPYAAANLAGLPGYYSTHPYSLYSQRMLAGSAVLP